MRQSSISRGMAGVLLQAIDNFHGLDADGGDALDEVDDVGRVVVLVAPVAGTMASQVVHSWRFVHRCAFGG